MRIASLLPSATELVAELGLANKLVAVSHECDFPPEVRGLPQATASILGHGLDQAAIDAAVSKAVREGMPLYTVDGALLSRLKPDLIVTQGICDVCAVTPKTIRHALTFVDDAVLSGVAVLSLDATSIDGVFADLLALGEAAGERAAAEARVAEARGRWAALAGKGPRKLHTLGLLEWTEPPFYGGHWVPEQIVQAGGRDVFGTVGQPSGRLTPEQVVTLDPDVLLVGCCGQDLQTNGENARRLRQHPVLGAARAVREGRLWAADANAFYSRPSLRLVRGAEIMAQILDDGADMPGEAVRVG